MAEYNSADWENIPNIIPASFISMNKQLHSVENWIKTKEQEETTLSLGLKMMKQEHRLNEKIDNLINEKQVLIVQLFNKLELANKEIEKLKEKPKIEEAVVQTDLTSKDLEDHSDISEDEHSEGEDLALFSNTRQTGKQVNLSLNPASINKLIFERVLKKKEEERKVADMLKPRMYSLQTFKKLMFKYLNRSKLKSKVLIQEQIIPSIEAKTDEISKKVEDTVSDFQVEIKNLYEQIEFYKSTLTKLYSEVEEKLKDVSKWSERVENKFTEIDQSQEDLKVKSEVIREDYDILKQFAKKLEDRIGEIVKELKDDIRKKVDSSQKSIRKDLTKSIEGVDVKIEETNKAIEDKYIITTEEYKNAIQVAALVQENITKDLSHELSQQIFDYRKFYESDMEAFQKLYNENRLELIETDKKIIAEAKKLRNEFDKWVSTVMEPAHISEARIFTVEARVKEEEAARLDQLHFVKDVMRKLFFSLEQAQITTLLPGARPVSRSENDPNVNLFMKRLGFLKKLVQYSVDQQKSRGNFVRKSSPFANKDQVAKVEDSDAPFLTEKTRFRESR